jgi:hypothetical protein
MAKDLFKSQGEKKTLVGCSRLFNQYIRGYPPYLDAVFVIQNLTMPHAMTG